MAITQGLTVTHNPSKTVTITNNSLATNSSLIANELIQSTADKIFKEIRVFFPSQSLKFSEGINPTIIVSNVKANDIEAINPLIMTSPIKSAIINLLQKKNQITIPIIPSYETSKITAKDYLIYGSSIIICLLCIAALGLAMLVNPIFATFVPLAIIAHLYFRNKK